jgi:hypothetical protein
MSIKHLPRIGIDKLYLESILTFLFTTQSLFNLKENHFDNCKMDTFILDFVVVVVVVVVRIFFFYFVLIVL